METLGSMDEALGSLANTESNRRGRIKKLISKVISESKRAEKFKWQKKVSCRCS